MNMDSENTSSATPEVVSQVNCINSDVIPCGTPSSSRFSDMSTSDSAVVTTFVTTTPGADTFVLPQVPQGEPPDGRGGDDNRDQLLPEAPTTAASSTHEAAAGLSDTQHLLLCNASPDTTPAPPYTNRDDQQTSLGMGWSVEHIGDIVRGNSPGGMSVVRRWTWTGVLLLVGVLPWIIAIATYIKQQNPALAGLLGLVFVFFMAVVLGRMIRRVQEGGWLQRQERRRRQYCSYHRSSQILMSEAPPPYEVVVKSPPPYSISCAGSPAHNQACHTSPDYLPVMTVFGTHLQDQANNIQSTANLDTRITSVHERDLCLPSYDEAVQHWKPSDNN